MKFTHDIQMMLLIMDMKTLLVWYPGYQVRTSLIRWDLALNITITRYTRHLPSLQISSVLRGMAAKTQTHHLNAVRVGVRRFLCKH
jgi:hypothetical protein